MRRHTGVVRAVLQAVTIIARRVVAPIVQDIVTRRVSIIVKGPQVDCLEYTIYNYEKIICFVSWPGGDVGNGRLYSRTGTAYRCYWRC